MTQNDFIISIKNKRNESFKMLRYETSVYQHFVELKEDTLRLNGYLDLIKIPRLYVFGSGQFLKNLRRKNGLYQKDIAKIIGVTRIQVNRWEKSKSKVPLKSLIEIAEFLGVSREKIYELIDRGEISTKTNLPVKFEKICDLVSYLYPVKHKHAFTTTFSRCSDKVLQKIKDTLNVNLWMIKRNDGISRGIINSRELYKYLKTFLRYTKVPKIQPPITTEVEKWRNNKIDLRRAIIIPCLQTDGYLGQQNPREAVVFQFYGKNRILHDYFVDAMYCTYKLLPSSYFIYKASSNQYATMYAQTTTKIKDELKILCRSTKTAPANRQAVEDYLKEPQPHLNYLINAPETEQKIALRIWASTEGCISVTRKGDYVYPILAISCAHPALVAQLIQITKRFNMNFYQKFSKRHWSGIWSLYSSSIRTCLEFLKIGGFIEGVKISAHSKYHQGIPKNILQLGFLEFKRREKDNPFYRKIPIEKVHCEINGIIKNKEFKKAEYYIDYFSKFIS